MYMYRFAELIANRLTSTRDLCVHQGERRQQQEIPEQGRHRLAHQTVAPGVPGDAVIVLRDELVNF